MKFGFKVSLSHSPFDSLSSVFEPLGHPVQKRRHLLYAGRKPADQPRRKQNLSFRLDKVILPPFLLSNISFFFFISFVPFRSVPSNQSFTRTFNSPAWKTHIEITFHFILTVMSLSLFQSKRDQTSNAWDSVQMGKY